MADNSSEQHTLIQLLDELGLPATDLQRRLWLDFLRLLQRWNRVFNLTSIGNIDAMLPTHLLDSLSVSRFIKGERVVDIGSGGGLPGIPLAIAFPQKQFTLVDAVAKKTRFLRQVLAELKLSNVQVVHARAEEYRPIDRFDQIISRAFSSLQEFVLLTDHLLVEDGEWLAMKGKLPVEELAALGNKMTYTVNPLAIPGLDAERHLIQINKAR